MQVRCYGLFDLLLTAADAILNIKQTPFILRCMTHGIGVGTAGATGALAPAMLKG